LNGQNVGGLFGSRWESVLYGSVTKRGDEKCSVV